MLSLLGLVLRGTEKPTDVLQEPCLDKDDFAQDIHDYFIGILLVFAIDQMVE